MNNTSGAMSPRGAPYFRQAAHLACLFDPNELISDFARFFRYQWGTDLKTPIEWMLHSEKEI